MCLTKAIKITNKIENVIRYGIVKKIISNRPLKEDLDPGVLR